MSTIYSGNRVGAILKAALWTLLPLLFSGIIVHLYYQEEVTDLRATNAELEKAKQEQNAVITKMKTEKADFIRESHIVDSLSLVAAGLFEKASEYYTQLDEGALEAAAATSQEINNQTNAVTARMEEVQWERQEKSFGKVLQNQMADIRLILDMHTTTNGIRELMEDLKATDKDNSSKKDVVDGLKEMIWKLKSDVQATKALYQEARIDLREKEFKYSILANKLQQEKALSEDKDRRIEGSSEDCTDAINIVKRAHKRTVQSIISKLKNMETFMGCGNKRIKRTIEEIELSVKPIS